MDKRLKKNFLNKLVKVYDEKSQAFLKNEMNKIASLLEKEDAYFAIEEQLEFLDIIGFRESEQTVYTIQNLLMRLKNIELRYPETGGFSVKDLQETFDHYSLIVKALEVLEHIRYHQGSLIIEIFLEYSLNANHKVKEKALHALRSLAASNIHVYFGGKEGNGLGYSPQINIIEKLESLLSDDLEKYFPAIIILCEELLSPDMTGTQWGYESVTFMHRSKPLTVELVDIRHRVIEFLKVQYDPQSSLQKRHAVLSALYNASRVSSKDTGNELLSEILKNSVSIVRFFISLLQFEDFEILRQLERDVYFLFKYRGKINDTETFGKDVVRESKNLRKCSMEFGKKLNVNEEFVIYKNLVGYGSILSEQWSQKNPREIDEKIHREKRINEYIGLITEENTSIWANRIVRCARVQSKDGATFLYFIPFLERLAKEKPFFAFELLAKYKNEMSQFVSFILNGLINSDEQSQALTLLSKYIDEKENIKSCAILLVMNAQIDYKYIKDVFLKVSTVEDSDSLSKVISAIIIRKNIPELLEVFSSTIQYLTKMRNASWIEEVWFRPECKSFFSNLDNVAVGIVLENLIYLKKIDYHAEEVLSAMAKKYPENVIKFLCKRFEFSKNNRNEKQYEPIPFEFYKLKDDLSQWPDLVVDAVIACHDSTDASFRYSYARLLYIIFPDVPDLFEKKLLQLVHSNKESNFIIVLAILRNYNGEVSLHAVYKELIKLLPEDDKLLNELEATLFSTGVTSGEFGLAEAYKRKKEEVIDWKNDENKKVRNFVERYIENLNITIASAVSRAEEDIKLRKHQFDSDKDNI